MIWFWAWIVVQILIISLYLGALSTIAVFALSMVGDDFSLSPVEEQKRKIFKVFKIAFFVAISISTAVALSEAKKDSFKRTVIEEKIERGLLERQILITNKAGEVIFKFSGNFDYSKDLNQVTIIDRKTGNISVFTIEDGMQLNLKNID